MGLLSGRRDPINASTSRQTGAHGLKRSWPDFLVLHVRLYGIELKRQGGTLSRTRIARTRRGSPRILVGQRDNFPELLAAGMQEIAVCHSAAEAIATLERWRVPLRGRISA